MCKSWRRRITAYLLSVIVILTCAAGTVRTAYAAEGAVTVSAPSVVLLEASTGKVIYEKDADRVCSPASITKIMTLLLIFEALEKGQIKLTDEVITSEHAQSMGGSQVFLETGELQTVDTLIKCIAVASGNAHHTTARDVAAMSRELVSRYPDVYRYTGIWMEDITHTTSRGSAPFTLSSTNKLLKKYQWATGLKTGSTAKAKYCLSATARKDGVDLIAVVMTAPDSKSRFEDAAALLNYGYSVSSLYQDDNSDLLPPVTVKGGVEESVPLAYASGFSYLDVEGNDVEMIRKSVKLAESVQAPVRAGEKAGEAVYQLNDKVIGSVPVLFAQSVEKAVYRDYVKKAAAYFLL